MSPWGPFRAGKRENTYSMYIKDQRSYQPKSMKGTCNVYILLYVVTSKNMILGVINRHYYVCCRDGKYEENKKPRFTKAKRPNQRPSRKLSGTCTSRIYVNEFCDGHVEVTYIAGHTGHELGVCELPHLSLPASVKDTVAMKLGLGIPADRIMAYKDVITDIRQDVGNRTKRNEFLESVSRKHFLNKCDIRNIRIKVQDRLVIRHQDDAQ